MADTAVIITESVNEVSIEETEVLVAIEETDVVVIIGDDAGSNGGGRLFIVSTEDYTLHDFQDGASVTNRGATADVVFTLPPSADLSGGEVFRFRGRESPYYLRVDADGIDVIFWDGVEVDYVRSQDDGACCELEYQGDGTWLLCVEAIGLWRLGE